MRSLEEIYSDATDRWEAVQTSSVPVLYVGAATCGRAAGAGDVIKRLKAEIRDKRIDAKVVEVGCLGLCCFEPLVVVHKPGSPQVCYGKVDPDIAGEPVRLADVQEHLLKELAVFGIAMLPISELRGAIPFGLLTEPKLSVARTYIVAVLGNFVPVIPILLFLEPVSQFLRRVPLFDRFFTWLFARTRRRGTLV